ncbi:LLM class flavin-dependent oxidoreductase [Amycolatopsis anabasis]|uniref:LLM class flavin-dependent oxidoreductase n=1 Tax=Amycolatopsis anabasis TaxID=1840409 RepID=UPI00131C01AB|nr:LLM class flavin-dependent oxidoreductase [Amycolatopsis anabasis]
MTDFGREIKSGYFLVPNAADPLLDTARELERLGYDYLAVQDHPYQRRYVDTWSLIGMVLGATSRIHVFSDVANLPLRHPSVLAKSAASFDLLSGGRFDLGLGAGAFWDAIEAYGGPRRTPGEALAAEEEAIAVIRELWSGERDLRFDGRFHSLAGAVSGPVPKRPIGIWLGSVGPRALALTGRAADGWIISLSREIAPIADKVARLDEAAREAGRDPGEIRRILNVNGTITGGTAGGLLDGPPRQWVDELTDLAVTYGFDTFVFWSAAPGGERTFVEEIIPAVREQVAEERA